jgi:hypothetical protein
MSTLVIVLRTVSLLAYAGPMLLGVSGRMENPRREQVRKAAAEHPWWQTSCQRRLNSDPFWAVFADLILTHPTLFAPEASRGGLSR